MRTVVVDETQETPTARAFSDEQDARAHALPLIRARLEAEGLLDDYPDLDDFSLEVLGEVESSVLILPEGPEGVWTGFSSADRCGIGGPLPDQDDPFYGNGDPRVYRTAALPDGQPVAGVIDDTLGTDDDF